MTLKLLLNIVCIPESCNTNISYQLFDYIITFVKLHHKNTNSSEEFVL